MAEYTGRYNQEYGDGYTRRSYDQQFNYHNYARSYNNQQTEYYYSPNPNPYCSYDYGYRSFEDRRKESQIYDKMLMKEQQKYQSEYYYSSKSIRDIPYGSYDDCYNKQIASPTPFIKQQDDELYLQFRQSTMEKFAEMGQNFGELRTSHKEMRKIMDVRFEENQRMMMEILKKLDAKGKDPVVEESSNHQQPIDHVATPVETPEIDSTTHIDDQPQICQVMDSIPKIDEHIRSDSFTHIASFNSDLVNGDTLVNAAENTYRLLEEDELLFSLLLGKSDCGKDVEIDNNIIVDYGRVNDAQSVFDKMVERNWENARYANRVVLAKALKLFGEFTKRKWRNGEEGQRESFAYALMAHDVEHTHKVLLIRIVDQMYDVLLFHGGEQTYRALLIRIMDQMYDILLLHGGATGCGVALEAVTCGLHVGLVEREDYSYGTSSLAAVLACTAALAGAAVFIKVIKQWYVLWRVRAVEQVHEVLLVQICEEICVKFTNCACPYGGCIMTETSLKLLTQLNQVMAEAINKVARPAVLIFEDERLSDTALASGGITFRPNLLDASLRNKKPPNLEAYLGKLYENGELHVGVRRFMRQLNKMHSFVIFRHNIHLGVLAAAPHAIATGTLFSVCYKSRTSRSEFIVSVNKYLETRSYKLTVGMRFKARFEEGEVPERSSRGTSDDVGDNKHSSYKDFTWRFLRVQWDEPSSIYDQKSFTMGFGASCRRLLFQTWEVYKVIKQQFTLSNIGSLQSDQATIFRIMMLEDKHSIEGVGFVMTRPSSSTVIFNFSILEGIGLEEERHRFVAFWL